MSAGGNTVAEYRFNGLNQRSMKIAGGVSTRFVYGPAGELLYEVSSSGALAGGRAYVWFDGRLVALGQGGEALAVHDDHLGRPRRVLDGSGATRWSAKTLGFDRSVSSDAIGGLGLGFAGQYYDAESGLWQNWHRTYDGTVGRYTQSDPIGLVGGINTYEYALGNPVSFVDPDGLLFMSTAGGAMRGVTLAQAATFGASGNAAAATGGATMATGGAGATALRLALAASPSAVSAAAQCTFKTGHYASRLASAGVSTSGAEGAVAAVVAKISPNMAAGASVVGRLTVSGVLLEYRAMMLSSGVVSVGTIFPVAGGGN